MTRTLFKVFADARLSTTLVDRRFSSYVESIGRFSARKVMSAIWLICRLALKLKRHDPKLIVFFATTRTLSFLVDWVMSEVIRITRIPTILYLHTVGYTKLAQRGKLWRILVKRLLGSAETIVTLGDSLQEDVRHLCSATLATIPNTLAEQPVLLGNGFDIAIRKTVLFLSNLIPEKGYDDFLTAAFECLDRGLDADFIMAGHAGCETASAVAERIRRSEHAGRVRYVGPVTGQQKWELIQSSRTLVFPSIQEALPLVQLEALACGVPIVAYRVGALAGDLEELGAGIIVSVGDVGGLVDGVEAVFESDQRLLRMRVVALQLYNREFTFNVFARRWRSLAASVMSANSAFDTDG